MGLAGVGVIIPPITVFGMGVDMVIAVSVGMGCLLGAWVTHMARNRD